MQPPIESDRPVLIQGIPLKFLSKGDWELAPGYIMTSERVVREIHYFDVQLATAKIGRNGVNKISDSTAFPDSAILVTAIAFSNIVVCMPRSHHQSAPQRSLQFPDSYHTHRSLNLTPTTCKRTQLAPLGLPRSFPANGRFASFPAENCCTSPTISLLMQTPSAMPSPPAKRQKTSQAASEQSNTMDPRCALLIQEIAST